MDTLKTVFVVGLLGVVLYFAYTFLSKEEPSPPPEVADLTEDLDKLTAPDVDLGPSLAPGSPDYQPVINATLSDESQDSVQVVGDSYGTTDPYAEDDPYAANDPYLSDTAGDTHVPPRPAYADNVSVGGLSVGVGGLAVGDVSVGDVSVGDVSAGDVSAGGDSADRDGNPNRPIANPHVNSTSELGSQAQDRENVSIADWIGEKQTAERMIAESKFDEALRHLSSVYRTQHLTNEERLDALDIMDPLAGKVVYSRDHLMAAPYVVQPNESLTQIAEKHNVPFQLLRNINGLENPQLLQAGTELKVIRGPFSADIDTFTGELTLYVQDMYAGRFAVRVGSNPAPAPGKFQVNSKEDGKTFVAAQDGALPKDHPQNPYGRVWIDLGNSVGIHGSHETQPNQLGCISLSPVDAGDVFGILSQGSTVIVR